MTPNQPIDLAALHQDVLALQASMDVRRVLLRYFELCDHLGPQTPFDELADLFAPDAVWAGAGRAYASSFGHHEGRDAIMVFLKGHGLPTSHFAFNLHVLANEDIRIDGPEAHGRWIMLQAPQFSQGGAFALAARIQARLARNAAGHWQITYFETVNLLSRQTGLAWSDGAPMPRPNNGDHISPSISELDQ